MIKKYLLYTMVVLLIGGCLRTPKKEQKFKEVVQKHETKKKVEVKSHKILKLSSAQKQSLSYQKIAKSHRDKKEYLTALDYFKKALAIEEKLYWDKHPTKASLYKRCSLKINKKEITKKCSYLVREVPTLGRIYHALGYIYNKLEKDKEALAFYEKALSPKSKELIWMRNKSTANFCNEISLLYYKAKDYNKAYYFQEKASLYFQRKASPFFAKIHNITYNKKKSFLTKSAYNMHNLIMMAFAYQSNLKVYSEKKKIIDEAFKFWLISKGKISNVESYLMEFKDYIKNNKKLKLKMDDYLKSTRAYATIYLKKLYSSKKFTSKNEQDLNKIEKERWKLEKYLTPHINNYSALHGEIRMHDEALSLISKNLNKNELYIDFIQTDKNYYLFTVNSKQQITLKKLSSNRKNIEKIIKNFRTKIINKENVKDIGNILYKLLFNKITNLKKYKKLIISPDGFLNLLPFEALWTNNKKYLIEEKSVVYVSSGKSLFKSRERNRNAFGHREIVSLSYLDYTYNGKKSNITDKDVTKGDKRISAIFHRRRGLRLLKNTKDEDAFMRKKFSKNKFISYSGKNATKDILYSIKSPQILHLSTHSFYGKDDKKDINPLLKSTLALSEFNAIISDYNPKGVLSALEFSTLNLYNTELVFFSSCESGLGDMHTSEGLSGLNRGARIAGAKRVISTLWSVDEKESLRLTKKFYTYLVKHSSTNFLGIDHRDNLSYASALRATKLAMIKQHPFYWAGFVQYGVDSHSDKKIKKVIEKAIGGTIDKAVNSLFKKLF